MGSKKKFAQQIVEWYRIHKRDLPWRHTRDPYRVWLSEIILQQTRVAQGIPYYLKFIERFPDVAALAAASEQEILRFWQGLGYYTRARNLHHCAAVLMEHHGGKFPQEATELQKLPGIGAYTAAAIASISFHKRVAVVDGNVFRVLARVFGIDKDISTHEGKNFFFAEANTLIPKDNPDEFNQAVMEFGALCCLPKNPACGECILRKSCVAFARDAQTLLPVNEKKTKARKRYLNYFVIERNNRLAMKKREEKDIWHGLYDFHVEETKRLQKPEDVVLRSKLLHDAASVIEVGEPSPVYKHILSHQVLYARFIPVKISGRKGSAISELDFYDADEIYHLPKPVLISRYLSDIDFL